MSKFRNDQEEDLYAYARAVRRETAAKQALGAAHEEDNRARLHRQDAWRKIRHSDPGFYTVDYSEGILIADGDYPDLVSIRR